MENGIKLKMLLDIKKTALNQVTDSNEIILYQKKILSLSLNR